MADFLARLNFVRATFVLGGMTRSIKVTFPVRLLPYNVSLICHPKKCAAYVQTPWTWGQGATLDEALADLAKKLPRKPDDEAALKELLRLVPTAPRPRSRK